MVLGLLVKLVITWRAIPYIPVVVSKMGQCVSTVIDVEGMRQRIHQLEQQVAAQGGGGGGAAYAAPAQVAAGAAPFTALFFPDPAMPCRHMASCRRQNCTYAHQATSLARLVQWLNSAKRSLDVCVFSITCDELAEALLAAHGRGVRVRVISDNDQTATKGSDVDRLRASGLPVRTDRAASHMHHKFAVLDDRFLLNGSFNWTRAGVLENEENVLILDEPQVAAAYTAQFERLWAKFA
ncbi:MAG: MT associated signaling protein phospholipase D [Monoraphidium minutum]|nr:MAG: MT associated signaling protein phospholipase D [Monoraphidium minutum]